MNLNRLFLIKLCLGAILIPCFTVADEIQPNPPAASLEIGSLLPEFALKDYRGTAVSTDELEKAPVVVFYFGVQCPIVQFYASRMDELVEQFSSAKVQWIGINSNQQDSLKEIEQFAKKAGIDFPLLKDPANKIADAFGATRTPEVFLFDSSHRLCYRGAIDDQYSYGQQKNQAGQTFLIDAINAITTGKQPPTQQTKATGCIIGRILSADATSEVTYSNQISRIIQRRCLQCHRDGEVAPFSMTDYDEVVGWAEMIQEVVDDRRMPPWHANPEHGDFKNDASLSEEELTDIRIWVAAGAPQGDPAELPEPINFVEGWQIGQPDLIIPMAKRPYQVQANGVVPYQHFVVDPGFTEDKWVQAAECRIGNRAVVHHIIVAVHDERNQPRVHGQVESEFITATAPGAKPLILPAGYAKMIPAGSKLIFQMHYTPNGTAQTDLSKVGFKFADPATVRKSVGTRQATYRKFVIPPGAENHEVTAKFKFPADGLILSMFPHMHLRGKSFRYTAKYPNGESEILLDVPKFDFNWQNGYELTEPKPMPKGTELECVAHFDNSEKNFANPDPTKEVRWGDQTWDEMMIGYFDMVYADQDLTQTSSSSRTESLMKTLETKPAVVDENLIQLAKSSLDSSAEMQKFGQELRQAFPQIDRVCWTTIDDKKLTVQRVAQIQSFTDACQGENVSTKSKPCRLYAISHGKQPVVLNDLQKINTPDMQHMSVIARSSFHIPLQIEGVQGTLNFWSSENQAFPESVQQMLTELAKHCAENGVRDVSATVFRK